jgi:hypothetical protein
MSSLSNAQLGPSEEEIRKKGAMNPDKGFVGNGFWWGYYPVQVAAQSGYGGYLTASQPQAVNQEGGTASVSDPSGLTGMPSN